MLTRALFLTFLCLPLAAQVTPVAGTGCTAATTQVIGVPVIGQQITIVNPAPCLQQFAVVAAGPAATIPWLSCSSAVCTIGVDPVLIAANIAVTAMTIPIPLNPAVIGACFNAQSACMPLSLCITLDQAIQICVQ